MAISGVRGSRDYTRVVLGPNLIFSALWAIQGGWQMAEGRRQKGGAS